MVLSQHIPILFLHALQLLNTALLELLLLPRLPHPQNVQLDLHPLQNFTLFRRLLPQLLYHTLEETLALASLTRHRTLRLELSLLGPFQSILQDLYLRLRILQLLPQELSLGKRLYLLLLGYLLFQFQQITTTVPSPALPHLKSAQFFTKRSSVEVDDRHTFFKQADLRL